MANRVRKIKSYEGVTWRYVPTRDNSADFGNLGGRLKGASLWWNGFKKLATPANWSADALNHPIEESHTQAKLVQRVLAVVLDARNEVEEILHKFQLRKAIVSVRG